jgi:hypothetical protein
MADTLKYTDPGSGATVSTDELTIDSIAQHVQRIKLALGANGSWQRDLEAGRLTAANSLSVALASDETLRLRQQTQATLNDGMSSVCAGPLTITTTAAAITNLIHIGGTGPFNIHKVIVSWCAGAGGNFTIKFNRTNLGSATGTAITQGGHTTNGTSGATCEKSCTGVAGGNRTAELGNFTFSAASDGVIDFDVYKITNSPLQVFFSNGFEVMVLVNDAITTSPKFSVTAIISTNP